RSSRAPSRGAARARWAPSRSRCTRRVVEEHASVDADLHAGERDLLHAGLGAFLGVDRLAFVDAPLQLDGDRVEAGLESLDHDRELVLAVAVAARRERRELLAQRLGRVAVELDRHGLDRVLAARAAAGGLVLPHAVAHRAL